MSSLNESFFVNWFKENGRSFPWREKNISPFALLITEMLLRQTQASAVSKLWYDFVHQYPNAEALAQAGKDELFEQLKILGFGNQRASALIEAATWLVEYHNGQVPSSKEELMRIPHIGMYVTNAILCFAYGQEVEVVDTNVLRFYSRYYGLTTKPDIRRSPEIWKIAKALIPKGITQVQYHNYGLLDFTALICKARLPRCDICLLASSCKWNACVSLSSKGRG